MTTVTMQGSEFLIDGVPTYQGRHYQGSKIQGMLFNVRAVQATFDDANPETRQRWAYPDTGVWDPDRNVDEFLAALPAWKAHGILGVTVNLQGGGPVYAEGVYDQYDNNAFTPEGALKDDYAARLLRILHRADELGMVVMVGFFYWTMLNRMRDEAAIWRAADEAAHFLQAAGYKNVLVELANEVDVVVNNTPYEIFQWDRVHEMVERLRAQYPELLYSTSGGGVKLEGMRCVPPPSFIRAADYVLIHGNGTRPPELAAVLDKLLASEAYLEQPKPVVINEDSPAVPNMEVCWPRGVSWGYYDQGFEGQGDDPYVWYGDKPRWSDQAPWEELSGFQTPPVNWTINTPFKRAFFERVREITGS